MAKFSSGVDILVRFFLLPEEGIISTGSDAERTA